MRPLAVLGPAGSGKTTAVEIAVDNAVATGAHVGIACPTGALAARYRQRFPDLDVDTVHGMFLLHMPEMTTLETMAEFDVIVIDEVGQLSRSQFERLLRLWDAAYRRPALIFVGDFHQLRSVEGSTAKHSPRWARDIGVMALWEMRRCKCDELRWKLELLRSSKPSARQLRKMLQNHRAPKVRLPGMRVEPTAEDVAQIMVETPNTVFVTFTKGRAEQLNELVVQALFSGIPPVTLAPGDPRDNWRNYAGFNEMVDAETPWIPIYIGMRLTLTRNLDKDNGFVNGMGCRVVKVRKSGIEVRTDVGTTIAVHPKVDYFDLSSGQKLRVNYLPIRLGYAVNLHKVQGQTLDHVTIWLDKANIPAAGYVALSRVRKDAHWRFVGHLTPHHFTPAFDT